MAEAQHHGPPSGAHRVGLLEALQALGLHLARQLRRVGGGQKAQPRVHHGHGLGHVHRRRNGTHLDHLLGHVATDGRSPFPDYHFPGSMLSF